MHSKLNDWNNGWSGLELRIRAEEIDLLISLLRMIKADPEQHFHLSSNYNGAGGIGDIEISIQPPEESSNMESLGRALAPGEEV